MFNLCDPPLQGPMVCQRPAVLGHSLGRLFLLPPGSRPLRPGSGDRRRPWERACRWRRTCPDKGEEIGRWEPREGGFFLEWQDPRCGFRGTWGSPGPPSMGERETGVVGSQDLRVWAFRLCPSMGVEGAAETTPARSFVTTGWEQLELGIPGPGLPRTPT